MIRTASALALLLTFAGAAQAYELRAKVDGGLTTVEAASEQVRRIGEQVGHNIPDSDQIRVHLIVESKNRANSSEILYNHRVELRKLFDGRDTPPYPVGGWFVIYTSEIYGIGTPDKARAELDAAIRQFFTEMKKVNPKTEAP
jgi:hypothetical protein